MITVHFNRSAKRNWMSRGYEEEVPCQATHCPAHSKFAATCGCSAAIKIGPDMKCQTGADLASMTISAVAKMNAAAAKQKPDGD